MGKVHVGIDLHLYSHIGVHFFPLYLTPCTKRAELYASVLQNSHTYVRMCDIMKCAVHVQTYLGMKAF